ncbi:hypothetical protein L917_03610 [Phytophthora nicotianae]|uniref:Uncharacterized protein n=1 Tax=Phytophthora nicotianae TaxID=4792 RepID=W2LQ74_PHYNI|nr:hypothetical protein L917_03610 [Phytophthora nicotianae]
MVCICGARRIIGGDSQADDTDVETTTIVSKALEQFLAMVVKRTAAVSPSKLTHY